MTPTTIGKRKGSARKSAPSGAESDNYMRKRENAEPPPDFAPLHHLAAWRGREMCAHLRRRHAGAAGRAVLPRRAHRSATACGVGAISHQTITATKDVVDDGDDGESPPRRRRRVWKPTYHLQEGRERRACCSDLDETVSAELRIVQQYGLTLRVQDGESADGDGPRGDLQRETELDYARQRAVEGRAR